MKDRTQESRDRRQKGGQSERRVEISKTLVPYPCQQKLKQPWVKGKWFRLADRNPSEVRVHRIDQVIGFFRDDDAGQLEHSGARFSHPEIADSLAGSASWFGTPIHWQSNDRNFFYQGILEFDASGNIFERYWR